MKRLTVLVTDDDKDIRDGIEIYLKNEGYNVLKASDGLEALQLLEKNEVHLIILDIMMPNMDGITATFKIRAERNIPIEQRLAQRLRIQIKFTDYLLGSCMIILQSHSIRLNLMARVQITVKTLC
ncbi:Transcriptional regulatory protein WalR [Ureibacillus acetophenoni]